jgi:hypothetical protein
MERTAERNETPKTSPSAPSENRGTHQNSERTALLASETEPISKGVSTSEQAPHLADVRLIAQTSAGGLMYLLNLIARTDLSDRVMRDHRLTQRGLRWTLHQLAVDLLALAPDDPAALAFAGLLPDGSPPNHGEEMPHGEDMPNDVELRAIDECRATLFADLRAALGDRLALADSSGRALIVWVCRVRCMDCGRSRMDRGSFCPRKCFQRNPPRGSRSGSRVDPMARSCREIYLCLSRRHRTRRVTARSSR